MQHCAALSRAVGTRQIDVLANNARGAASHCRRNRGPGSVPSVRNRVVLPGRVSLGKGVVKPTNDVDFAVNGIVGQVRISTGRRHWSAGGPSVSCDVVNLGLIPEDIIVIAPEYIHRVGVAGVDRSREIHSDWNICQVGPGVTNGIVAVKKA